MQNPSYGKPLQNFIDFDELINERVTSVLFVTTPLEDIIDFMYEYNRIYGHVSHIPAAGNTKCTLKEYMDAYMCYECNCAAGQPDCIYVKAFRLLIRDIIDHLKENHIYKEDPSHGNLMIVRKESVFFNGYKLSHYRMRNSFPELSVFKIKKK